MALQLLVLVVGVAALAGGLAGAAAVQQARASTEETIAHEGQAAADLVGVYVREFVDSAQTAARELANRPDLRTRVSNDGLAGNDAVLERWLQDNRHADNVSLYDLEGINRSTGLLDKSVIGRVSIADRPYFIEAVTSGRPSMGVFSASRVTGRPTAPYAAPVLDERGSLKGVLVVGISLNALSDALATLDFGRAVDIGIVDIASRVTIASTDRARIFQPAPLTDAMLGTASLPLHPQASEATLTAFAPVANLNWGVLVQQDRDVALAPVDQMAAQTWWLVGICVALAALVGAALAARIVRPLQRLRAAAELIAAGDFSRRTGLVRGDEIGDLGRAFDQMGESVESTFSTLREQDTAMRALAERERALREVTRALAANRDEHAVVELAVQQAASLLQVPYARVWLLEDEGTLRCAAASGFPHHLPAGSVLPEGIGVAREVAKGHLLNIRDAPSHPLWVNVAFAREAGLLSYLGAPLLRAGRSLGALLVMRGSDRPFDQADEALLQGLASAVAVAASNARTLAQLEQQEQQLQRVLHHMPNGVFVADASGRIVYQNQVAEELLGLDLQIPGGMGVATLGTALQSRTPDGLALDPGSTATARALRGEVVTGLDLLVRGARTGNELHLRISAVPLCDRDGAITGAVIAFQDTTREREAQQERERRQQELARTERLRSLGQMASGVAHDLNQSLGIIAGYSELAARALEGPNPDHAALRDTLALVARAALDGGETIKGLLTLTRSSGPAEAESVDVGALLRDVGQLTAPRWRNATQAEGRPVRLEVVSPPDLRVRGHRLALREALMNLVFNAVDALPAGGTITLRARLAGESVEIEVADDGVGIPRHVQANVFEPFFTTKGEKGTGLGLAQVHAIVVDQHGGRLSLESTLGRGTTLRMAFPAATPTPGVADTGPGTDEGVAAGKPGAGPRRLRVLAVDDEAALARMAALMLSNAGHEVEVAASGEEALRLMHARAKASVGDATPFDVVVSDLGLGDGMNGWDLAAAVQASWPRTRFVLATGWGASISPEEALTRGAAAVIAKPYRAADLLRAVAAEPMLTSV